jgi:hypothetical protein
VLAGSLGGAACPSRRCPAARCAASHSASHPPRPSRHLETARADRCMTSDGHPLPSAMSRPHACIHTQANYSRDPQEFLDSVRCPSSCREVQPSRHSPAAAEGHGWSRSGRPALRPQARGKARWEARALGAATVACRHRLGGVPTRPLPCGLCCAWRCVSQSAQRRGCVWAVLHHRSGGVNHDCTHATSPSPRAAFDLPAPVS